MSNLCQVLTGQALLILFTCCYLTSSCATNRQLANPRISNLVDLIKSCRIGVVLEKKRKNNAIKLPLILFRPS